MMSVKIIFGELKINCDYRYHEEKMGVWPSE